jgi:FkbM family methyltransferase
MGIGLKIFKKFSEKIMNEGQVNNKIISKTGRYIYKKIKPEFIEKFGYKLYLDPDDHLMLANNEYTIHPILKKIIHGGDTVIDIGANIGVLTLFFRKLVGNEGMIYSFEPNPVAFSILKKNINENNLTNIQIEDKAVSNKNDKVSFTIDSSITNSRIAKNHKDVTLLDCVSMDEYFTENKMKKIDFVKIDTEGYDLTVLEGMTKIIQLNPELKIMVEFHTRLLQEAGTDPHDLLKFLHQQNFKIYDMGGLFDRLELLEDKNFEIFAKTSNASNLLCVHNEIDTKTININSS